MIFVTVGHQTPFDRLLRLVDVWCEKRGRTDVIAQIGDSNYISTNFETIRWMSPKEYREHLHESVCVVAHAGTGTIIQVLMLKKPLLVLPRLASLAETRSDHQLGTARHFHGRGLLLAAEDENSFIESLDCLEEFRPAKQIGETASASLIRRISSFINV